MQLRRLLAKGEKTFFEGRKIDREKDPKARLASIRAHDEKIQLLSRKERMMPQVYQRGKKRPILVQIWEEANLLLCFRKSERENVPGPLSRKKKRGRERCGPGKGGGEKEKGWPPEERDISAPTAGNRLGEEEMFL